MTERVQRETEIDLLSDVWDPNADKNCIVCHRPSGGRAICDDESCARELANG